jgi:hypothetical protein
MIRVVLPVAFMLLATLGGVSGCFDDSRPDGGGDYDARGEYRCPGITFRPITVDMVRRVMKKNGYDLHATDASDCHQEGGASIELSNVIFHGPHENKSIEARDRIVATQGDVICTVRERPLYDDRVKIVSSTYAWWFYLSYQNFDCGVTGSSAFATPAQYAKLKVAVREVVRTSARSQQK